MLHRFVAARKTKYPFVVAVQFTRLKFMFHVKADYIRAMKYSPKDIVWLNFRFKFVIHIESHAFNYEKDENAGDAVDGQREAKFEIVSR